MAAWKEGKKKFFVTFFSLFLHLPLIIWIYQAIGSHRFLCARISMLYFILMFYFQIFAYILNVQMEYAVISLEFIVDYLP